MTPAEEEKVADLIKQNSLLLRALMRARAERDQLAKQIAARVEQQPEAVER